MGILDRLDFWFSMVVIGIMAFLWVRDRVRSLVAFAGTRLAFRTNSHPAWETNVPAIEAAERFRGSPDDRRPELTPRHPRIKDPEVERFASPSHPLLPRTRWWLDFVDHDAHIMIVGPTRSGKSTTARALLVERARTDDVLVIDPHGKFNDWGVPVVGDGRDFAAIASAMDAIHREFQRRFAVDQDIGEPLTIFVDEYPAIVAHVPQVASMVKQWLREAAKAKIRLVFLAQDASVKTLGIEGEGAVRANVRMLLLGALATAASPVAAATVAAGDRAAVLMRPSGAVAVSINGLNVVAEHAIHPSVLWQVPEPVPALLEATESALEPVPASEPVPEPGAVSEKRAAAFRQIKAAGISTNVLATAIGGNRATALEMIRQATAEETA